MELKDFAKIRSVRIEYARRIDLMTHVFGSAIIRSYEEAKEGSIISDFCNAVGISTKLENPEKKKIRDSLENRAVLWLQSTYHRDGKSNHPHRLLFALSDCGRDFFKENQKTTLWSSSEDADAFVTRHRASFEIVNKEPNPISDLNSTSWSVEEQVKADTAFDCWEQENGTILQKRAKKRLRFYDPSPNS
jgi:hypothetical protein